MTKSPQRENGHLDIANELVKEFCRYRLSGREWQILWVILYKTWGFIDLDKDKNPKRDDAGLVIKKKFDRIPLSQFANFTGIDRRKCHQILKSLENKGVIIIKRVPQKGDRELITYGIQKNYSGWTVSPKKVTPPKTSRLSPKTATKLSPKTAHSKDNKDNIYIRLEVDSEYMAKMKPAYPDLNVEAESHKADAWLIANPGKKYKDHNRFFKNWLDRADRGRIKIFAPEISDTRELT